MLLKKSTIITAALFLGGFTLAHSQQTTNYNLANLLQENKLDTTAVNHAQVLPASKDGAISTKGIVFLKDVSLKNGTIDVDLRGKDVFLQSFLGIAFHAKDTLNFEVVYFRPFRFHSTDTPTRKWSVQYTCMPKFDYEKLRKEHPGVYENTVTPVPGAEDWFHATIVIKDDWITVYVNHAATASLNVKGLGGILEGKIGLWASGLSGDFAGLSITE